MAADKRCYCSHKISRIILVITLLTVVSWSSQPVSAQGAVTQYTMDQRSDCLAAGYLTIPRDQVTKLIAPSKDAATTAQTVNCRLQFQVETQGDTLRVSVTPQSFFKDCNVSLNIQMINSNSDQIILGCKSNMARVPALEAVDGKVSVWLARKTYSDTSYWFEVTVTAVRTEAGGSPNKAGSENVGLIVGCVAAAIVIIVILVVICVCCYRRRKMDGKGLTKEDQDKKIINSHTAATSHGYENNMAKISYDDSFNKSPDYKRKLLSSSFSSENETNKPRSALERFGNVPANRGEQAITGRAAEDKYEERDYGKARPNYDDREPVKSREFNTQKLMRDVDASAPQKIERDTETTSAPQKSSVMSALHNNPRFRKSFQENEADADERVRRVSEHSSITNSSSADSENFPVSKPRLPPISKSPPRSPKSPPRSPNSRMQGGKNATISRDRHSSASSSEESGNRNTKTKHTLRPTSGKNKKSSRKHHDDITDDDSDERRKNRRHKESERKLGNRHKDEQSGEDTDEGKRKERNRKDEQKSGRRNKDDGRAGLEEHEKRVVKGPGSIDESDDRSQYEGRFKKSASGRKPKAKGQRMGRSRSTGNALEELDSNYQSTRSKSPSSLRSFVLADDDDELDSNYEYFKRSGSKTSLYASRSSLYGRRRKNSMGETVSMSSYMHDDVDSRMGDFDKHNLSHKEKERLFKSTGDLDSSSASVCVFRECATQTDSSKEVYVYGRRTIVKSRVGKRVSRGTQTGAVRERRDSAGSVQSGRSARSNRLKSRSKSQESLRKQKSSRSRDLNESDNASERSHRRHGRNKDKNSSENDNGSERSHSRRRTKSRDRDLSDNESKLSRHRSESSIGESDRKNKRNKSREKEIDSYRPKHNSKRSLKSASTASYDFSDSDDDKETVISSVAPSSIQQVGQHINYIPQYIPAGHPMSYPQPGIVYSQTGVPYMPTAPGGPPLLIPAAQHKPAVAPKPNTTKWDQLVNLTEGMKKRRHQMGESLDTESVLSSAWSQSVPHGAQSHIHYSQVNYHEAHRIPDSGSLYTSSYPESIDITKLPKERFVGYNRSYAPTDSNV